MDLSYLSHEELQAKVNESAAYVRHYLDEEPQTETELFQLIDALEIGLSAVANLLPNATGAQLDELEALLREQGLF